MKNVDLETPSLAAKKKKKEEEAPLVQLRDF